MSCIERVGLPNYDVLKRLGERRMLTGTIVERRGNVVSHLLRHSNWFTALAEGTIAERRGGGQEYMDGVKEGRQYVVIKRLSMAQEEEEEEEEEGGGE